MSTIISTGEYCLSGVAKLQTVDHIRPTKDVVASISRIGQASHLG